MWGFISGLLWLVFWLVVILGFIAFKSYNKLQANAQAIREGSSNIQVAVSKKLTLLNQLIDVVKNYQESEQFIHLKIAQDSSAAGLSAAYQQSGVILTSLQGVAERFPNLKANEQYHRLVDNIETCESNIQGQREGYNQTVRQYNTVRLSMPTVFVAGMLGFSVAPYLEFDITGAVEPGQLKNFKTDDGERLQQLLSNAGGQIAGASREFVYQASQVGKLASESLKGKDQSDPDYFYQVSGGVPAGPLKLKALLDQVKAGQLPPEIMIAQAGSTQWLKLADITTSRVQETI